MANNTFLTVKPKVNHGLLLTSVGNLCAQWAYVEYLVSRIVWQLLKLDDNAGMIVTGGRDLLTNCEMAIQLSEHFRIGEEQTATLKKAKRDLQNISADRNLFVHGIGKLNTETGELRIEAHRNPRHRELQEFSAERVAATSGAARDVQKLLEPLVKELKKARDDSPET